MKVILAGMSKTGTKTMNAALSILGYKVYDFLENGYYLGEDWVKIVRDGAKVEDFRRMYKDVDAVTDTPCYFYWEELLEAFPDAKIILTVRDEESWYNSVVKQLDALNKYLRMIAILTFSLSGWKFFRFRAAAIKHKTGDSGNKWPWSPLRFYDKEALKRLYRKHNREVMQNAPKDKLLIYEVKQGWKPLCDFLGVEVPHRKFPYKNKGASVYDDWRKQHEIMHRLTTELYWSLAVLLVVFGFAFYMLFSSA